MKKLYIYLSVLLFFVSIANPVFAHRDGCHRWHSCPSDSGSYECGDLGYDSGCSKGIGVQSLPTESPTRIPTKTPTQIPTSVPTKLPTKIPTKKPTAVLTQKIYPTISIKLSPTDIPSLTPTDKPTPYPTRVEARSMIIEEQNSGFWSWLRSFFE